MTVIIPAVFVGAAAFKIQQNGLFQLDVVWTDFAYLGLLAGLALFVSLMFFHFPYTFPPTRSQALKAVLEILLHFALILTFTRSQSILDVLSIFGLIVIQANTLYFLYITVVLGLGHFFRHVFLRHQDRPLAAFIAAYLLFALITLPVFILGLFITFIISTGTVMSMTYSIPLYLGDATGAFAILLVLQYFIALITVHIQTSRVHAVFVSDQQEEQDNIAHELSS